MSAAMRTIDRPKRAQSAPLTALALVLAYAAGATDAFAFLLLGGVFTANMTGNLVLAGLTERPGYHSMITGVVVAIIVFCAALYGAFRVARSGSSRIRLVAVLLVAVFAQVTVLATWLFAPGHASPMALVGLIALSSVAMAAQTAVARRVEVESGVTTTYVTGTLTSIMRDWADHTPQAWVTRVGVVIALVAGALSGSLLIGVSDWLGALLPVIASTIGAVILGSLRRSRQPNS